MFVEYKCGCVGSAPGTGENNYTVVVHSCDEHKDKNEELRGFSRHKCVVDIFQPDFFGDYKPANVDDTRHWVREINCHIAKSEGFDTLKAILSILAQGGPAINEEGLQRLRKLLSSIE